jgi:EAL domain-containing protein (putative c-di-GMP-specific phosphodiesterase class I)
VYPLTPHPDLSPMSIAIASAYQPIVALDTRRVVGFEALTRAPAGSPWERPQDMFAAAYRRRETAEFDWKCRLTAVRGALAVNFPVELALFVNAEPSALNTAPPPGSGALLTDSLRLSVVVEITERNLMRDPAGLLRAVEHARHQGWRIAVDDVGSDSSSLALLALLRPDVIKLDMRLVQQQSTAQTASILAAVTSESERTGAIVLAEGIETEAHERWAQDVGAAWGQGWLYGEPGPLPVFGPKREPARQSHVRPAVTVRAPAAVTPYGLTHSVGAPRRADGRLLETMEDDLLRRAAWMASTALVLVTMPVSIELTDTRRRLMAQLGSRCALTAVFSPHPDGAAYIGTGHHADEHRAADGGHCVLVDPNEPLALERSVIVVDPGFTGALISVDRGRRQDGTHLFDYRLSFDRELVLDAATVLLRRIPARAV